MVEILPAPLRRDDGPRLDPATHSAQCQRLERRLVAVCAALPEAWTVPPLTVLASFTWWRGDGALTRIALDRALAVDPDYRLARAARADGRPGDPAVRGAARETRRRVDSAPRDAHGLHCSAGHEFQHRAPACWAATLLRGGVPRVMTRPSGWQTASAGPAGPRSSGSHRDRHLRPAPHAVAPTRSCRAAVATRRRIGAAGLERGGRHCRRCRWPTRRGAR